MPTLSLDEFLEKLKQTPRTWVIGPGDQIRCWVGDKRHGELTCPIHAVAGRSGCNDPFTLATQMGLPHKTACMIADAADQLNSYPTLRARLLAACGLGELESLSPRTEGR